VPAVIGFTLFGVFGGLAVVSGRIIAKWIGWLLLAAGVLVLIPPISSDVVHGQRGRAENPAEG
jgi:hypothetical protein